MRVFLDGKERGMDSLFKKIRYCCVVGLLCTSVLSTPALAQDFRLYFVPGGEDPTGFPSGPTVIDAFGAAGSSLVVDIFVANAPVGIRGPQLRLPCSASGGITGEVLTNFLVKTSAVHPRLR